MINCDTKACFMVDVTPNEAAALLAADEAAAAVAAAMIDDTVDLVAPYEGLPLAFRAAFPGDPADPFATFRRIFSDPGHPTLDVAVTEAGHQPDGRVRLIVSGDEAGVEEAANLVLAVAKSALPFGFIYGAFDDRVVVGEFGGGYFIIASDGVSYWGYPAVSTARSSGRRSPPILTPTVPTVAS